MVRTLHVNYRKGCDCNISLYVNVTTMQESGQLGNKRTVYGTDPPYVCERVKCTVYIPYVRKGSAQ